MLAGLALTVLAAAPHVFLQDEAPNQTSTTELRFWWDQLSWDLDHETVPGAAALYGAISAVVLATGTALAWLGDRRNRHGLIVAGLATTLAGATATIHYSALWTGRLLTTLVHTIAGFDAPAALLRTGPFTPDAYSSVWTIAPTLVLGLALAAVIVQARGLAARATGEFDLRPQAALHTRAGWMALIVLAVLFAAPLSAQELPDNLGNNNGATATDNDTFWFSAYDTYRIHEGTSRAAEETNRGNLVQYEDLGRALWLGFSAVLLAGLATVLGTHGTLLGAQGDRNLGNLWQGSVYAGITANVGLFILTSLIVLLLHRPNADIDDRGLILGLGALIPVFMGLLSQIAISRTLMRESGTLLADDFPEPITYD